MMKKIIILLLTAASLTLGGCTNNTDEATIINEEEYIVEDINITNSNDALQRLKDGNARFLADDSTVINVTSERRNELVDHQNPYAIVVSCSDSRVTPSLIFNVGLGEIFDIRIAGNVVDDDALGSIEYAVDHLHSPLLVIMGHESCGAVTAAYDSVKKGVPAEGKVASIVEKIAPVIGDSNNVDEAVHKNINAVYDEVLKDEIVQNAVNAGKLTVVKAYYDLDGTVLFD